MREALRSASSNPSLSRGRRRRWQGTHRPRRAPAVTASKRAPDNIPLPLRRTPHEVPHRSDCRVVQRSTPPPVELCVRVSRQSAFVGSACVRASGASPDRRTDGRTFAKSQTPVRSRVFRRSERAKRVPSGPDTYLAAAVAVATNYSRLQPRSTVPSRPDSVRCQRAAAVRLVARSVLRKRESRRLALTRAFVSDPCAVHAVRCLVFRARYGRRRRRRRRCGIPRTAKRGRAPPAAPPACMALPARRTHRLPKRCVGEPWLTWTNAADSLVSRIV